MSRGSVCSELVCVRRGSFVWMVSVFWSSRSFAIPVMRVWRVSVSNLWMGQSASWSWRKMLVTT